MTRKIFSHLNSSLSRYHLQPHKINKGMFPSHHHSPTFSHLHSSPIDGGKVSKTPPSPSAPTLFPTHSIPAVRQFNCIHCGRFSPHSTFPTTISLIFSQLVLEHQISRFSPPHIPTRKSTDFILTQPCSRSLEGG